jgi:hypothetical protein
VRIRSAAKNVNQEYSLELDEQDAVATFGEEVWDGWSVPTRWQKLSNLADSLVVTYMAQNDWITPEFRDQRLREIQARG